MVPPGDRSPWCQETAKCHYLIGRWIIQVNGKPYEFNALTAIDTVTNLVELGRIDNKTSAHVARVMAQLWLARYPWPEQCVHDNGDEFVGPEFQTLIQQCKIKEVTTSTKNPQANSIYERMHQTVGNALRILLHGQLPKDVTQVKEFIKCRKLKYGKLATKIAITTPWEALCVDLIGPYTLKGKDGTQIDFMCLTMIDPASSWFEIVELPVLETLNTFPAGRRKGTKVHEQPKEAYFDKS